MQVSVLLEATVVFVLLPTNVTRVPKVICGEERAQCSRNSKENPGWLPHAQTLYQLLTNTLASGRSLPLAHLNPNKGPESTDLEQRMEPSWGLKISCGFQNFWHQGVLEERKSSSKSRKAAFFLFCFDTGGGGNTVIETHTPPSLG